MAAEAPVVDLRKYLPLLGVFAIPVVSALVFALFVPKPARGPSSPYSYGAQAVSPDGRYLAATWQDKVTVRLVRVWDYRTGAALQELSCALPAERRTVRVAFSADGSRLLVQTDGHEIEQWETAGWTRGERLTRTVPGADADAARSLTLIMGTASDYCVGFDNDQTFYRFRYGADSPEAKYLARDIDEVDWRTIRVSRDGGRLYYEALVYAEPKDKEVVKSRRCCVVDLSTGQSVVISGERDLRKAGPASCVAFSVDGAEISIDFADSPDLCFFDTATGRELHVETFAGSDSASEVWFGPGDLPVVVYYQEDHDDWFDRQIRVLDRRRGYARLEDYEAPGDPLLVSPDGATLLCSPRQVGAALIRRDLSTKADTTLTWTVAEATSR